MRALAIDVGTSSVRTAIVDTAGVVSHARQERLTIRSPNPGEVELDATEIVDVTLRLARATLQSGGACDVVGITNQRATTIVFDVTTGLPVGPALGWQDLRTVIDCLVLQSDGVRLAPNQSATKVRWLMNQTDLPSSRLRFATIESWIAWHLTEGAVHISDQSNAGVSGLVSVGANEWDGRILGLLNIDPIMLPTIVDTMADHGIAAALEGAPHITAMIGDQPASLFGQSCVNRGVKITFGTGAMLNMVRGTTGPHEMYRFESGCFPVVLRSEGGRTTWGIEGIVLSAGACIEWLRDDLGLIQSAHDSEALARSIASSDGVAFVPALLGLGTPQWDFGARGAFFGLTRGTTKAHLVRSVLEGIAQRGADLLDAAREESGQIINELRVDGGMVVNEFFVQRLADFTNVTVTVSPELEATTRGAGLMALVSAGAINLDDVERLWNPTKVFVPTLSSEEHSASRAAWADTVSRAERTIPELSAVEF